MEPSLLSKEIDQAIDALQKSLTPWEWNDLSAQQEATKDALESLRHVLRRHEEILAVLYPEHELSDLSPAASEIG